MATTNYSAFMCTLLLMVYLPNNVNLSCLPILLVAPLNNIIEKTIE